MIDLNLTEIELKIRQEDGRTEVFDPVRRRWVSFTPEEHVRQLLLHHLLEVLTYPKSLVAVEKAVAVGNMPKRFDIVVYNRNHTPWMLVECKAPEVPITQNTLQQLLNYQRSIQSRYWVLCNGLQTFCADANDPMQIEWMRSLPLYEL